MNHDEETTPYDISEDTSAAPPPQEDEAMTPAEEPAAYAVADDTPTDAPIQEDAVQEDAAAEDDEKPAAPQPRESAAKVTLALTLALALLFGFAVIRYPSAQAKPDPTPAEETPALTAPPAATEDPEAEAKAAARLAKYTKAYEKYSPDTVVMYVNGRPIPWSEYFSWLYSSASQLEDYFDITDWSEDCPELAGYTDGSSYNAYVRYIASVNCTQLSTLQDKAAELGAELSEEQQKSLEDTFAGFREKEDFSTLLAERFLSEDYFYTQYKASMLYDNLYTKTFGENGEKCSDEDALQYVTDQGYMYAKHILFKTVDDSNQPLDEATVAKKKADADAVLLRLREASPEELPALFDNLMQQYSEDPGMSTRPDGYYFLPGAFVAPFEEAAKTLAVGGLSGIVESTYGYHIIYRPAMSADHLMDYDEQYRLHTVRSFAATALFSKVVFGWYETADIKYEPGFETLDMNVLLAE